MVFIVQKRASFLKPRMARTADFPVLSCLLLHIVVTAFLAPTGEAGQNNFIKTTP
jgi:hypothetical protein